MALHIGDGDPNALLEVLVGKGLIALELHLLALVRVVLRKNMLLELLLLIVVEAGASIVVLADVVFLLFGEGCVKLLAAHDDLALHDPLLGEDQVIFIIHEPERLVEAEDLQVLIVLLLESLAEEEVGDLLVELLDVLRWEEHGLGRDEGHIDSVDQVLVALFIHLVEDEGKACGWIQYLSHHNE